MANIVVFGAGQIAEVATAYIEAHGPHRIVGYTVDGDRKESDQFLGKPLIAWEALESVFPPDVVELLGPLSYRRLNQFRRDRYLEGKARGYRYANFVHPGVELLHVSMGENCFILGACTIEPYVRLGNNIMIWSKAHIGHHALVDDHCFIGPGAGVGGNTHIGECCMFGPKADLQAGFSMGASTFVGAGAQVKESVEPGGVYIRREGTPRAKIRSDRLARTL